jgi:hypothetical protein
LTIFDDDLASFPARIAELRKQLEPLENGTRKIGARHTDWSDWVDKTPQHIELGRSAIADDERFLTGYRDRDLSGAAPLPGHSFAPVVEVPQAGLPMLCGDRVDDARNALLDAKACL